MSARYGHARRTNAVQVVLADLAAGQFRRYLLRQHVERRIVGDDAIEIAAAHRAEQGRALDEVVARHRQQPALRCPGHGVARTADALQECRDAVRRSDLAHQVHVADVDAKLERRRGHERLERPGLEPVLRVEARFLCQAAMVRGHLVLTQAIAEVPCHALGQPPGVDEHQRRPMRADQLCQPVVVFLPDLVLHHGAQRRRRDLERQIQCTAVPFVNDLAAASRLVCADEKARHLLYRLLRGREAKPEQRALGDRLQALE